MGGLFELEAATLRLNLTSPRSGRHVRHAVRKRLPNDASTALTSLRGTSLTVGTLRNITTELTHFVWELRTSNRALAFGFTGLAAEGLETMAAIAGEPLRQLQVSDTDVAEGLIVFVAGRWDNRHGERERLVSAIVRRDGSSRCVWCGQEHDPKDGLTLDHLLPRTLGGSYEADNLVIACRACNSQRGHLCPRRWVRQCRHASKRPNLEVIEAAFVRYERLKREAAVLVPTLPLPAAMIADTSRAVLAAA